MPARAATILASVLALALAAGCFPLGEGPGDDDDDVAGDMEADLQEYDELAAELEATRTRFLGDEADEILARRNSLYWLEFPGWDPTLHRWDADADERVDYAFSIGSGDAWNYRTGGTHVLTATPGSDEIVYRAYDAAEPESLVDTASLPAPTDGQRWWAYAADGSEAWIVRTDGEPAAWSWALGQDPDRDFAFAEAGVEIGLFLDFDVEDGRMVFLESGRIWSLDLGDLEAAWLGNETEVTGSVSFDGDGVLFAAADGLYWADHEGQDLVNVGDAISASPYRLNDTFTTVHRYAGEGAALHRGKVVYIGGSGVFAYDLHTEQVEPILLEPRDAEVRVVYRNPQVLEDGTLFLQALESESGSIGADGPIYRVDTDVLGGD